MVSGDALKDVKDFFNWKLRTVSTKKMKGNAIIVTDTTVHLTVKMNFGSACSWPTNQGLQGKPK